MCTICSWVEVNMKGSTSRAAPNLRTVSGLASRSPRSICPMVSCATPLFLAKALWLRDRKVLIGFNIGIGCILLTISIVIVRAQRGHVNPEDLSFGQTFRLSRWRSGLPLFTKLPRRNFSKTRHPGRRSLGNLALSCVAIYVLRGRWATQDYFTGCMVTARLFSELPRRVLLGNLAYLTHEEG